MNIYKAAHLSDRKPAMTSKPGNGKRLTGSQLGYRGKGVPDPETIAKLQMKYCDTLVAGELPAEVRAKLERMRMLADRALRGEERNLHEAEIAKLFDEIAIISSELTPILHFHADEVDWET
jgi:hypothetical protein